MSERQCPAAFNQRHAEVTVAWKFATPVYLQSIVVVSEKLSGSRVYRIVT